VRRRKIAVSHEAELDRTRPRFVEPISERAPNDLYKISTGSHRKAMAALNDERRRFG